MFALTNNFCKKELNYIEKAFCANNNYPKWVKKKSFTASQTTAKTTATARTTTTTTTNNSRCSRKESFFITPL